MRSLIAFVGIALGGLVFASVLRVLQLPLSPGESKWWRRVVALGLVLVVIGLVFFAVAFNKHVRNEESRPSAQEFAEDSQKEAAFLEQQNWVRRLQNLGGMAIGLGGIAIVSGVLMHTGAKRPDGSPPTAPPSGAPAIPVRFCTSCGSPIPAGGHFCGACGSKAGPMRKSRPLLKFGDGPG